jgi:PAS domain S-box-containing protein
MGGKTMGDTRYKIMLIEDDRIDQLAFKQLVEEEELPYDCTIAASVSETKSILDSERFDVVICDYLLGDGTAFDILDLIDDTPVIVITGTGNEEIVVKAWRSGAYDYLVKDINRNYLKAVPITVENALRHKKAEWQLRLLSGAVMSTDDSVYITDIDDKIIFVNKAFCRTYGYKRNDILGRDCNILWIGKHQSAGTRSVLTTQGVGGTWQVAFYHRRKDGSIFPVSLSRSIVKGSKGNKVAVVATARDITERILVEDELHRANQRLKEQNRVKSELAVMVSQALDRLLDEGSLAEAGALNNQDRQRLDAARNIIRNFHDIIQIDAGTLRLEQTELDFGSIVSEVVQALLPVAEQKNVELDSSGPEQGLLTVGDRDRILQALTGLISNSILSTPARGHVEVRLIDADSEIRVEVHDEAPSIEAGEDKTFDCFERFKEQLQAPSGQNLSLSLPIVKQLVEIHGAHMSLESGEDGGNTFCLSFPKRRTPQHSALTARAIE